MKNLNRYLIFIFCACVISANAQVYFNKLIQMPNGEYGASVLELPNGDYLIGGQSFKYTSQTLFFLRTNAFGDTVWSKEYGQPKYYYYGSRGSLNATNDGNFIFAGTIMDSLNNYDALLVKLTPNGDTLWTKTFGGLYFDAGRDCQQTVDGGYILVADSDSLNNGMEDFLLIKTDNLGNKQWQRRYNAGNYEVAFTGEQTVDKGYLIAGSRDLSASTTSHWIVKTDSAGSMQWNKTYGSGGNDGAGFGKALTNSQYAIVGGTQISGLSEQSVIRKLNSYGNLIWQRTWGGNLYDYFYTKPVELWDSSIVIAGTTPNSSNKFEALLVKYDKDGNKLWHKKYNITPTMNRYIYDFKNTSDNGFILSGQSNGDVWLVKVDSNGCEIASCNVGINEFTVESLMFKVFPNPASNEITISIGNENSSDYTFEIRNVLGELQKTEKQNTTINISQLATGIYFIIALSKDGKQRMVEKFVKE